MIRFYKLVDRKPVVCSCTEWVESFNDVKATTVNRSDIDGTIVSTVFVGIAFDQYAFDNPALFESMIFGGALDQEQQRCATLVEAEAMHLRFVDRVKESQK